MADDWIMAGTYTFLSPHHYPKMVFFKLKAHKRLIHYPLSTPLLTLSQLTSQTTFLILSPWFPKLTINLPNNKSLTISTTGGNKDSAFYVQSLKVNGKNWEKAWVTWDDIFANGGSMEFVLGSSPKTWATGDPPPSPASGDQ